MLRRLVGRTTTAVEDFHDYQRGQNAVFRAEIAKLRERNGVLEAKVAALEALVTANQQVLESQVGEVRTQQVINHQELVNRLQTLDQKVTPR